MEWGEIREERKERPGETRVGEKRKEGGEGRGREGREGESLVPENIFYMSCCRKLKFCSSYFSCEVSLEWILCVLGGKELRSCFVSNWMVRVINY